MIQNDYLHFLNPIADYYDEKLKKYGGTPKGVDWNNAESQLLRFEQLSKIIMPAESFSINDIGCGYGAYYDYLKTQYSNFFYTGIDISGDMIKCATSRHAQDKSAQFMLSYQPQRIADYSIASGIFNIRLENSPKQWLAYIENTLNILNNTSHLGFAFNCLTSYSDKDKMQDYLYYADPLVLFDFCKKHYSRNVALLHDYDLYEFTILVRRIL